MSEALAIFLALTGTASWGIAVGGLLWPPADPAATVLRRRICLIVAALLTLLLFAAFALTSTS